VRLWFGALLMEGTTEERAEVFTADGWYRRPLP
jgi:hypothetical protein